MTRRTVNDVKSTQTTDPRLPSLLSVEEAAALLGISRSAAYRAALADALPTIRWGRRIYVPAGHLLRLLGTSEADIAARISKLRNQERDPWERFIELRRSRR